MADVESKSIPHELPSSHWLKATGQCVPERYLSATMMGRNRSRDQRPGPGTKIRDPFFIRLINVLFNAIVDILTFVRKFLINDQLI